MWKKIRSVRLFGIAVFDVVCTLLAAFLLHTRFPAHPLPHCVLDLFLLGIILHRIFGVRTTIDKLLFK